MALLSPRSHRSLDVGYLFMAAPAKCSLWALPWRRGISSLQQLLTLNLICITVVPARATSAVWAVVEKLPTTPVLWLKNLTLPRIGFCVLTFLKFPRSCSAAEPHGHVFAVESGAWLVTLHPCRRENSYESCARGAELSMRHQRTVWLAIQTMKKDRLDFDFLLCEI